MQYISPLDKTPIETNVVDENYPTWDSSTTYNIGDKVILGEFYFVATLANSGKNPQEFNTLNSSIPVWGHPTLLNTKRCLNVTSTGSTSGYQEIYYKFDYRGYSTIALLQTIASNLEIKIYDENANLLHTIEDSFVDDHRTNYVRWRNGDYYFKDSLIIDMPFYPNGSYIELRVKGDAELSIGFIVFGHKSYLGSTQVDIPRENSAINPSYVDDLGNVNIQEEPLTLQYIDVECLIKPEFRREVIRNVRRIIGRVAFFISTEEDEFNDLNFLAVTKSATDTTKVAGFGDLNLELEGYVNVNFY